jgi:hypothetical protein
MDKILLFSKQQAKTLSNKLKKKEQFKDQQQLQKEIKVNLN